ncbi:hemerythrin domain-containing protein [Streptomyces sp. TBY4]|uniref:hemerythrin domain-containing protein n=1 Tax=Streptomyces sp. TBY4 TaxID=2962030 RepID=UPI0020B814DE|nr:hemerythrin domain-containing protein [Streptomyces sp. TBY4]MCP3760332.1 hemerythrin domain-containing protein [Streptomyces sp. TBY4]
MAKNKDYVDLTIMLVSHDAFRRDIRRLEKAVAGRSLEDPTARKRVLTGWEIFKTQLLIHHEGEDRDLWPRMAKGFANRPEALSVLAELEAEHEQIDPLLARIEAAVADGQPQTDELAEAVTLLGDSLETHLAHEEKDGLPYIQEALTEKDWKAFIADQRDSLGFKGAAEFFPWVLDEATQENVDKVSSVMPAPLRLVMKTMWTPAYQARGSWAN